MRLKSRQATTYVPLRRSTLQIPASGSSVKIPTVNMVADTALIYADDDCWDVKRAVRVGASFDGPQLIPARAT